MDDLERAQPTILFDVKDASGADAIAVKVTLDGHPLTDKLQGSALPFDPGEHVFTFTLVGHDPVTRRFLVKEGEKDRRERIVMGATPEASAPPATPAAPPPSPTPTPPPAMTGLGAQRIVGLTTGGFGVAGLAVGSIFGLLTFSAANAQKSDCTSAGDCASHAQALSDHASGEADAAVSTVAFIVGGVLLVTGGTLFFTAHTGPSVEGSARALTLAPIVGRDTGGMSLWGEF
jgi:hypothetical protein